MERIGLNFLISFSTSWALTLYILGTGGLSKQFFISWIAGCDSYLLVIKSIAEEKSVFV